MSNQLIKADCLEALKKLPNESVDALIFDPPYLYIKKHKLDRFFDELKLFRECFRVLKKGGFLIYFGRGIPFYRWGVLCSDLGFNFKEELVWDKIRHSSPVAPLLRTHEQMALFSKGQATINKVWINKIDSDKLISPHSIEADLKRLVGKLRHFKTGSDFVSWRDGEKWFGKKAVKHGITVRGDKKSCHARSCYDAHIVGKRLASLLRVPKEHHKFKHPTQKPVELMKLLVELVSKEGDTICDPFMGSGSTGKACKELGRNFIGMEIDDEYFEIAKEGIEQHLS